MRASFITGFLLLCSLSFASEWVLPSYDDFKLSSAPQYQVSGDWNVSADWLLWNESGRSFLSDVERRQLRLGAGMALPYGAGMEFDAARLEETFEGPGTYEADVFGIAGFVPLPALALELRTGFSTKDYQQREAQDSDSYFVQIRWSPGHRASLYGSFARTDQIYNYFGLFQGTRADTYSLAVVGTNVLQYHAGVDLIEYLDGNEAARVRVLAGRDFQAGPGTFNVRLGAEYRDAKYKSYYLVAGDNVAGIIFPYWAPRDYTVCSAGFAYALGYSDDSMLSIGADLLYDTEEDTGFDARIKWRHKWFFLRGTLFRSDEWDSEGLAVGIQI